MDTRRASAPSHISTPRVGSITSLSCARLQLISTYPRYIAAAANAKVTLEEAEMHPQATLFVRESNNEDS